MRPGPIAALGLTAATVLTRSFAADGRRPALRLEYEAPSGCPSAADFAQQVERRRGLDQAAEGSSPALSRRLRVEIRRSAHGVEGHLVLVGPDGQPSERSIAAADCRGVASALALIAALALDRNGFPASATPAPTAPVATAPVATAPTAPAPTTASAASPAPSTPSTGPLAAIGPLGPDRNASSARRVPLSFSATAAGLLTGGMAPEPTTGWTALAGLSVGRDPLAWRAAAALLLRVGVAGAPMRSFSGPNGEASFDWIAGVAEACPISVGAGGAGQLRPCVVGEYGVVRATGSETMNPASVTRPWAALGVELRLSWALLGPVSLDAAAGALASIERDRFTFATLSLFETPAVVARVALGLGIAVP
jgi:hypothetical protein